MSHRTRPVRSSTGRAAVAVASFAAFGLLATACSDSKSISGADVTQSSASSNASTTSIGGDTTSTTVPTSSTAVATSVVETTIVETTAPPATTVAPITVAPTVAPPPAACAGTSSPSGGAVQVTPVVGDWNGDGVDDAGVSWGEPNGSGADWFVRTEVTGGESSTWALGDLGVGFAALLDSVDVDFSLGTPEGTNRDELLAIVGSNASGYNLGVFGVGADGCIFRFDNGAGVAFVVPVAGSVSQVSGVRCDGGAGSQFLVALHASTSDGISWDTEDARIDRIGGHSLALGMVIAGSLPAASPLLDEYGEATCGGHVYIGIGGDY